jgi:hypothetical protein
MRRTVAVYAVMTLAILVSSTCMLAQDKPIDAAKIEKIKAALPDAACAKPAKPRKIIIFTMTKGFRHDSIPLATEAFRLMGEKTGAWETTATDDPAMMAADKLKAFDAIVWNQCTGNITDDQALKDGILNFVKTEGKGLIGVHAATDAGGWKFPEFHEMVGGLFNGHPFRKISVKLDDPASPIMKMFEGKGFEISDEIYTFKAPYSREKLRILMSIDWDNAGITKGMNRDDNDYALSWIQEFGKGRVFYCAFGHDDPIWWNPTILKHYLAGSQYALGDLKADATPSAKVKLQAAPGPKLGAATPVAVRVYAAPKADDGWIVLFDGKNLDAWQEPGAKKWKIAEDGVLERTPGSGNIWTKEKFGDFILSLEWKAANAEKGPDGKDKTPSTNSGVFLRSAEGEKNWLQGSIEIQVSNSYGPDRKPGKHDAGAMYDCAAPTVAAEKPVGEWNEMVITFKGNKLNIVLNGKTIQDLNLDDWKEAHLNPDGSKNKFNTAYKDMAKVGYLGLQDHGQPVWYRNIKVKPLDAAK